MRKIVVSEFLTLDGVMQGPGSPDEDRSGGFDHGGWHTFMAAHWPNQPDTDMFAGPLNNRQKYVVSTTLTEPLPWQNSTLISREVPEAIAALKKQPGGDISVLGSGELVQTLLKDDLVDELSLMIDPLVLGSGKRLFRDGLEPIRLQLAEPLPWQNSTLISRDVPEAIAALKKQPGGADRQRCDHGGVSTGRR